MSSAPDTAGLTGSEIAIIGMACRFPGASTVEALWRHLCAGDELLSLLSDEELRAAGVPESVYRNPNFVRRSPVVDRMEFFDAEFFGYTPLEARVMDPQQRLFLECAWSGLERAGYDPGTYPGAIGVFTGAKTNTYLFNLFQNRELFSSLDTFQIALGNDLACMATRVSFKLGLTGPSYAVHTACSTSLVAVHLACQSLLLDECQMALAGGAAINVPQRRGYLYQPGGIVSPDGSCRTFDAKAQGSNFGNGAGVVVLKRLEDALADGDHIHAVIKGSATNNDGAAKASFTAPGVRGQAAVIVEALACSGVEAESISYVEAHGTATDLGDSIEMLALTEAFRASTDKVGFCGVGSVKTNLGHLETAAGVAGMIKTALALEHRKLPPSLHYERPNPKIDFAKSPFFVVDLLRPWRPAGETPLRAGLSSFGIGSTNAHAILEEPPRRPKLRPARPAQLLLLSARTETALATASENLAAALAGEIADEGSPDLADAAYTLQVGRRRFDHRRAVVCRTAAEAVEALRGTDGTRSSRRHDPRAERPVAFLLPGLGDQRLHLARGLYDTEASFRETLDRCFELLRPRIGTELREVLYPGDAPRAGGGPDLRRLLGRGGAADDPLETRLRRTVHAQPALFAVEYALARLWMSWGVKPRALIGYSLGEYVAACLAGVLSLEDALTLVAERSRLIDELEPGAMMGVSLPEAELRPRLGGELGLAAVNGPGLCVVSGPAAEVEALEAELVAAGVACRRLATSHAFHSPAMTPVAERLERLVSGFQLRAPEIPYLSNVTGTWIRPEEASAPAYWARHLCATVRFADGIGELLREPELAFLEMGTGQSLSSFVKLHPACDAERSRLVLASLPGSLEAGTAGSGDDLFALHALGKLWSAGVQPDWSAFHAGEERLRVPLPSYPFEGKRHWVDPDHLQAGSADLGGVEVSGPGGEKKPDPADWFYAPRWRPQEVPPAVVGEGPWLIFGDPEGLGGAVAALLEAQGERCALVDAGDGFERLGAGSYRLAPAVVEGYDELLRDLRVRGLAPRRVLHLWNVDAAEPIAPSARSGALERAFYSPLFLLQALGRQPSRDAVTLGVVATGLERVGGGAGDEPLCPEKATLRGPVQVAPQELSHVAARSIGVLAAEVLAPESRDEAARRLVAELSAERAERAVAYRGAGCYTLGYEALRLAPAEREALPLREGGTYWLTGGLGGVGLVVARYLAERWRARLVLSRRRPLPPRAEWGGWLAAQGPEDETARIIAAIQDLERSGAEVLVAAADAADAEAMARVLAEARSRFGPVDGVFHAAGVGSGGLLQLKSAEAAAQVLAPKVAGTRVLEEVLSGLPAGEEPAFVLLFSSLQSALGDFGQVDYCAANAFLDSFAAERAATVSPTRVVAVGWDNWQEVGIAVNTELPPHMKEWQRQLLAKAITSEEGVDLLERVLAASAGEPHWVVSTQELEDRIAESHAYTAERILREFGGGAPAPAGAASALSASALSAVPPRGELEHRVLGVWQKVLGHERVGLEDNFFDLGGNSLVAMQLINELNRDLGTEIAPVTLFEAPTAGALIRQLLPAAEESRATVAPTVAVEREEIAIIGMAGRFPGAADLEAFWTNLAGGVESTRFFTEEELLAAGISQEVLRHPTYVKARPILDGVELFDAGLFGYSPREAETIDPQHRLFLETSWQALEDAGEDPQRFAGQVGVFAGCAISTYLLNLYTHPELIESVGSFQTMIGNEKDSLPTRVSYKLDLRGPSVAVQTFCSTSLVAVHMACRSLLSGECDLALAGGASVHVPQESGYHYQDGGFVSPDGRVKAFDAKANGFIFGNGVGVVVLKRLSEALRDGDPIRAVIKGSAINNDGSLKVGYTATSVEGQSQVVIKALEAAGVSAESIQYVEAHGTGTALGDPVEVAALTKAFRRSTERTGFCPLGSVKTNIGHLDRAAGVSGLIKAVLALEHAEIPPSLHFDRPNPQIDFDHSPFYVTTERRRWPVSEDGPRRAGVNSLGLGGTNAHVVLEEAPPPPASGPSREWQILALAAHNGASLEGQTERLADHLERHGEQALADVAFTLLLGRRALAQRRVLVCRDRDDALDALRRRDPRRLLSSEAHESRPVYFLFPGLGGQYVQMGRGLYAAEPVFRTEVDRCSELLEPHLGFDLRSVLFPGPEPETEPAAGMDLRALLGRRTEETGAAEPSPLDRTGIAQPALFVVEYALARLWLSWGVVPAGMVGYSLGEYVAAAVAGVLRIEDALELVARRAALIEGLEAGAMLAVSAPEEAARRWLGDELSLAAVNGPEQSVLAGPVAAVAALEERLGAEGVACRRLQTSHAFHSSMMVPLFEPLAELVRGFELRPPEIPYLSNVTGRWLSAEEAVDPLYWSRHMVEPVRFSTAIEALLEDRRGFFLELGPQALGSLVLQHPAASARSGERPTLAASLRHAYERRADAAFVLDALAKAWGAGVEVDWRAFFGAEERRKVRLPTYAFDRQRFWVEARIAGGRREQLAAAALSGRAGGAASNGAGASSPGLFLATWRRGAVAQSGEAGGEAGSLEGRSVWLLSDGGAVAGETEAALRRAGASVSPIYAGSTFGRLDTGGFLLDPTAPGDWRSLVREAGAGRGPEILIHQWCCELGTGEERQGEALRAVEDLGGGAIEGLLSALESEQRALPQQLWLVTEGLHRVVGGEVVRPWLAPLVAMGQRLAGRNAAGESAVAEETGLAVRCVDLEPGGDGRAARIAGELLELLAQPEAEPWVALRGGFRWLPAIERFAAPSRSDSQPSSSATPVTPVLVVNGLGQLGLPFVRHLASEGRPLLLLEGVGFPRREEWQEWRQGDAAGGLISTKIAEIEALEAAGARIRVEALDEAIGNGGALDEGLGTLLAAVEEELGPLGAVLAVFEPEAGDGSAGLRSKAGLLEALDRALAQTLAQTSEPRRPPRCLLLSALPGATADAADPALGLYLDAFAAARRGQGGLPWTSARWGLGTDGGAELVADLWRARSAVHLVASPSAAQAGVWSPAAGAEAPKRAPEGGVAYYSRPNLRVEFVAPRDETESAIAAIWSDLLGVGKVGIHDNFLELGGDSLLATRLISRMRDAFHLDLPIRLFFEASTVAELALAVQERLADVDQEVLELIEHVDQLSEEDIEREIERLRRESEG